jgi:hypothetical protein
MPKGIEQENVAMPSVISQGVGHRSEKLLPAWSRIGRVLILVASLGLAAWGQVRAQSQDDPRPPAGSTRKSVLIRESRPGPLAGAKLGKTPPTSSRTSKTAPKPPAQSATPVAPAPVVSQAKRFRIRDEQKQCVVARLHGQYKDKTALLQPDGQIGFPDRLVPTIEPFVPVTSEALRARLQKGPYAEYQVLTTQHYVIFFQSKRAFAEASGRLLEDLYRGLTEVCRKHEIPVHETEFPLVAVIFANERDFRAHKQVEREVQAYYEIFTNRIFFYQQSDLDRNNPKVSYLRKPQTVAHEGAHQILANIGVQPRLSEWPFWLIEGLAEYCATPAYTRKGIAWDRLGMINSLHMATLRELADPLANEVEAHGQDARPAHRDRYLVEAQSLVTKDRLTPTDYAQAWALTHYLALRRGDDFVRFLKAMSQMPPLEPRTPEQHLAEFRKFFGEDLVKIDKEVDKHIRKLSTSKGYDPLPYYAVIFEQPLLGGMVHRAAWISQSPQMIDQWVEQQISPQGGIPSWQAFSYTTRTQAILAAGQWMRSNP